MPLTLLTKARMKNWSKVSSIITVDVDIRRLLEDLNKNKSVNFCYKLVYRGSTWRLNVDNPTLHRELFMLMTSNEDV